MAQHRMDLTETVFDDVALTCTITFRAQERPAPPVLPDMIDWYPRQVTTVTATFPVRRRTEIAAATGIAATLGADGNRVLTRYTWNGTAWVDPVLVDHQDQPLP